MDLNLDALTGFANLVPIALTLRKVYAPDFDVPEAFKEALAKLESSTIHPDYVSCLAVSHLAQHAPSA